MSLSGGRPAGMAVTTLQAKIPIRTIAIVLGACLCTLFTAEGWDVEARAVTGPGHEVSLVTDGSALTLAAGEQSVTDPQDRDAAGPDAAEKVEEYEADECNLLFSCETRSGKFIRICGEQDEQNVDKWTNIQYRFGLDTAPPELAFPKDPAKGEPSLFFSHEEHKGDYRVTVRFSTGGYTYRVFSGSKSGAGVEVTDSRGKKLATVECIERPLIFPEYLRLSLPCDPRNPHGAAACKKAPYTGK